MASEADHGTGSWGKGSNGQPCTNCDVKAAGQYNNQGCGITGSANSYGAPFNANRGGVFATEWTAAGIQVWYFARGAIPSDIASGKPAPSAWGRPYAKFDFGASCPSSHFKENNIIFDLTFCGDWASSSFGKQCPNKGSCNDFVKNSPADFTEAYWLINYVKVFSAA